MFLPLSRYQTENSTNCQSIISDCRYYGTLGLYANQIDNYDWSSSKWNDTNIGDNKKFLDFVNNFIGKQYSEGHIIRPIFGAQFSVEKEKILCHELKYFEAALDSLNSHAPIESHYMERLWDLFFICDTDTMSHS